MSGEREATLEVEGSGKQKTREASPAGQLGAVGYELFDRVGRWLTAGLSYHRTHKNVYLKIMLPFPWIRLFEKSESTF